MKTMTPDEFRKYRSRKHEKDYVLIDVRTPVEYRQGHIPGSLLIPLDRLEDKIDSLPGKDLIFYCRSGARSKVAAVNAEYFIPEGYATYNLDGGLLSWDGKHLDGIPAFKAVRTEGTPAETLLSAIDLEKGAWRFYSELLKKYPDITCHTILEQVRDGELGHANLIYAHLKKQAPDTPPFDELYGGLEGEIVEGGSSVTGLVTVIAEQVEALEITVLETAVSMEYQAYDLYRILSDSASSQEIQEAFQALSQAEKQHMSILLNAIASIF